MLLLIETAQMLVGLMMIGGLLGIMEGRANFMADFRIQDSIKAKRMRVDHYVRVTVPAITPTGRTSQSKFVSAAVFGNDDPGIIGARACAALEFYKLPSGYSWGDPRIEAFHPMWNSDTISAE